MNERRTHPRVHESAEVVVKILSAPENHALENRQYSGLTSDLSADGLRLRSDAPLAVGGLVEMSVTCAHPTRILRHIGRVVWVKDTDDRPRAYDVGIKFTETPEATLAAWTKILRDKLSRASGPANA